ncbi:hypothetical protein [Rhizobium phage RHEph18]|uniref:hypothetical protein n=1 Tax=Rhizobium TaxID=379 RepID=UPI0007EAED2E|nr:MULTISPECIES: hypothetical protein [Rhizobium]ANL02707.1 hypothetical protein AMJ99_CH01120 [Rhizobium esperanzae]ANM33559.1 hypothetical protein AMK04_CH01121 [Rhizobium sp. N871]QIG73709.1 hypothetical protein EVC05_017 [Rhizobium phage RHph_N2]QXV74427.1 hypothetical protein [Rhizobium phage RHEph18]
MRLSVSADEFPETDISTGTLFYGTDMLDISSAVAGKCYDVFQTSSGLVAGPEWTNGTTRDLQVMKVGSAIVNASAFSGIATGDAELVGGFRCHANGQTRSTKQSRLVWSLHDAVLLPVCRIEPAAGWSYSTAQWRQANGNALNQIEMFCGVSGRLIDVTASAYMLSSTSSVSSGFVGIGLDTSSADSSQVKNPAAGANTFPILPAWARYVGYAGIGYHELRWLERGIGGSAQTWLGNGGQPHGYQTGILGSVVL